MISPNQIAHQLSLLMDTNVIHEKLEGFPLPRIYYGKKRIIYNVNL